MKKSYKRKDSAGKSKISAKKTHAVSKRSESIFANLRIVPFVLSSAACTFGIAVFLTIT